LPEKRSAKTEKGSEKKKDGEPRIGTPVGRQNKETEHNRQKKARVVRNRGLH